MSYKDFEIYQLARELSVEIHKMTLKELPKFEMFEEGSKNYKQDFLKYLYYALSSNDETIDHFEMLYETKSLND
jgi:hypothetical protein